MATPSLKLQAGAHEVTITQPGQGLLPGEGLHQARRRELLRGRGRWRPARRLRPPDGAQALRQRRRQGAVLPEARAAHRCRRACTPPTSPFPSGRFADLAVCDEPADLLWAINLGCLDLNPWPVRDSDVDRPDELRIDLDPTPEATFEHVKAAGDAGQRDAEGLRLPRLRQDVGLARHPHQRAHRAEVGVQRTCAAPHSPSRARSSGASRRSPPRSGGRKSATASSSTTTRTRATAPSPAPTRCARRRTRASRAPSSGTKCRTAS